MFFWSQSSLAHGIGILCWLSVCLEKIYHQHFIIISKPVWLFSVEQKMFFFFSIRSYVVWTPMFFKIMSFVFHRRKKKNMQVLNDIFFSFGRIMSVGVRFLLHKPDLSYIDTNTHVYICISIMMGTLQWLFYPLTLTETFPNFYCIN